MMSKNEEHWQFAGTPWEFIQLVRRACVVYEYVRQNKLGILDLLSDTDAYLAAAEETGITYDVVKEVMRWELTAADHLDQLMEEVRRKRSDE